MEESIIGRNAETVVSVKVRGEWRKIAHLGPVICTSGTSTAKVTYTEGVQNTHSAQEREVLKGLLSSLTFFKVEAEKSKLYERTVLTSKQAIVEKVWEIHPSKCKKSEHEILQFFENITYSVTRKGFFKAEVTTYNYEVANENFLIRVNSERMIDPACDDCPHNRRDKIESRKRSLKDKLFLANYYFFSRLHKDWRSYLTKEPIFWNMQIFSNLNSGSITFPVCFVILENDYNDECLVVIVNEMAKTALVFNHQQFIDEVNKQSPLDSRSRIKKELKKTFKGMSKVRRVSGNSGFFLNRLTHLGFIIIPRFNEIPSLLVGDRHRSFRFLENRGIISRLPFDVTYHNKGFVLSGNPLVFLGKLRKFDCYKEFFNLKEGLVCWSSPGLDPFDPTEFNSDKVKFDDRKTKPNF
jgi:hypothetical protein